MRCWFVNSPGEIFVPTTKEAYYGMEQGPRDGGNRSRELKKEDTTKRLELR